ncbi:MAG: hypothetical protein H8E57_08210 [Candidatus Cloacimonetes bacterium]|nr:hypothetical protein [Candidatus Cloacimonadota bacterium]
MEKIDIHNTSINDLIKTMIRKGIADNSIKADVEEEKLVKAFWGQLDGLIPLFSFNNSDESKDVFSYVIFLIRTAIKKI